MVFLSKEARAHLSKIRFIIEDLTGVKPSVFTLVNSIVLSFDPDRLIQTFDSEIYFNEGR